jgi:L-alanine-DL-glutamate epimerase-like enolase superfamily enzyme
MKIAALEVIAVGPFGTPPPKGKGNALVTPLSILERRPAPPPAPTAPPGSELYALIVALVAEDGTTGYGTVALATGSAVYTLEHHLKPLVVGADVFDTNLLWETMYRATLNHGRKGLVLAAISAVDIAVWDLIGRLLGQPIYNLLGGRVRETIPVYASRLYATEDLDALAAEAEGYLRQGFRAMKLRFGHGPREGPAGMWRNVELVRTVREVIGDDVDLMADAYMGWDVAYCTRILPLLEPYRLRWIEEPVSPDDVEGYARVKELANSRGILISGGEHEYTRYGMRQLLERRAVDVLQPDTNRVGSISEAQKVWAMAAAHDIPVIPHAGQSHNYHLVISHLNSPLAEYFPPPPAGVVPDMNEAFWWIFSGEPRAEDGHVRLAGKPGLGLELNQEVVETYRVPLPL